MGCFGSRVEADRDLQGQGCDPLAEALPYSILDEMARGSLSASKGTSVSRLARVTLSATQKMPRSHLCSLPLFRSGGGISKLDFFLRPSFQLHVARHSCGFGGKYHNLLR